MPEVLKLSGAARETLRVPTTRREELVDITDAVRDAVARSGVQDGLVALYAQGATGALMIQENWDESVARDVVKLLAGLVPRGVWEHDRQDGNGDSHLKAGLVGPSETIPLILAELEPHGTVFGDRQVFVERMTLLRQQVPCALACAVGAKRRRVDRLRPVGEVGEDENPLIFRGSEIGEDVRVA